MGVDAFILLRLTLQRTNILSRNKNITFCLMLRICDKRTHVNDFMLTLIYRYGCIIKFSIFFCVKKNFSSGAPF